MYAQIYKTQTTKYAGKVVWAEITKEDFDDCDDSQKIIILTPEGERVLIYKRCLKYLSNDEQEAHAIATNDKLEKINAVQGSSLVIMFHNPEDMGYGWFYGMKSLEREEVGKAVAYMEEKFYSMINTYPDCDAPVVGEFCNDEDIPILNIARVKDSKYLYYWVSKRENSFAETGIVYDPEKLEFFIIMDKAIKAVCS